jgi:hypothetical protein
VAYSFCATPHGDHAPSAIARAALVRYAPGAEVYELGIHPDAYYTLLCQLWADGDGWLNVEQDIEIHDSVIPQLEACPEPWCLFAYQGAGYDDADRYLYGSLGCTRFSSELMTAHPQFMQEIKGRSWQQLDSHILPGLLGLGYTQHIHWPAVLHHHVRRYGMGERCDCRQPH